MIMKVPLADIRTQAHYQHLSMQGSARLAAAIGSPILDNTNDKDLP